MALSNFDRMFLSDVDKAKIVDLTNMTNATKDQKLREQYHAAAEAIRSQYGYSGGSWGNQFIQTIKSAAQTVGNAVAPVVQAVTQNPAATSVSAATDTLSPTTSTGVEAVQNSGDYAIVPAPMTAQFQRVLTLGLGVIALGFVAKMFSRKG